MNEIRSRAAPATCPLLAAVPSLHCHNRCLLATYVQTRKAFVSTTAQPFLVSGSGAMGWDVVATNLISEGGKVDCRIQRIVARMKSPRCRSAYQWGYPAIISSQALVVLNDVMGVGLQILVTNTGFFCTRFENCLKQFGLDLTSIHAPAPGSRVLLSDVEKALKDAKA